MTATRRVVVTGSGLVTPRHVDVAEGCAAAFAMPRTAEVREFDASPHFRVRKAMKVAHRVTRFAVAAASMALADGRWADERSREDLGVVIGTSGSDPQVEQIAAALAPEDVADLTNDIAAFSTRLLDRLNPLWLLIGLPNMASAHVAIQLQARGPNSTVMTDWVAGAQAIGEAVDWIQSGEAPAVLAGGADTALVPHALASYDQAGLHGFVPGEGAAVLLLEDRAHALARGAPIRGEIEGYATAVTSCQSSDNPLLRTMRSALATTKWLPDDVCAVGSASAFGPEGAAVEEPALHAVFGRRASTLPRVENTSRVGHALGAASAIEVALLFEQQQGVLIANALGFSGQATTLAFSVPQEAL